MRLDDFLIAYASALLRCEPKQFEKEIEELADFPYQVETPRAPNTLSVGGVAGGRDLGLIDWATTLRVRGPLSVKVSLIAPDNRQLSGFEGVSDSALVFGTGETYRLQVLHSSQNEIDAQRFAAWIDKQSHAKSIWKRIGAELSEFLKLNDRPGFDDVRAFFETAEGANAFESMGARLLNVAQIVSRNAGASLNVEASDAHFFDEPSGEEDDTLFFLNDDAPVSELVAIVEAQSKPSLIWKSFAEVLEWNGIKATERAEIVKALDPEKFRTLGTMLLNRVRQEVGDDLVIPPGVRVGSFADRLSPEARLDYLDQGEALQLAPNSQNWQYYRFAPIEKKTIRPPLANARTNFETALHDAISFDERVKAGFAETFKSALGFLSGEPDLTNQAVRWLSALEPNVEVLKGLSAIASASVFGGMGSWNDLGFADPKDQAEYDKVSGQLYHALNEFKLSIFNQGLA